MLAVASMRRNDPGAALEHLHQAVPLNAENRNLARQDPDLDALRNLPSKSTASAKPDGRDAA